MKKQTSRKGLFFFLLAFAALSVSVAQSKELKKDFHEEYSTTDNTKLILENKYGNIDLKDWDQNKITIDVLVTVEHSNQATAEKMLEYINVEFSQSGDEIKAKTVFDERFSKMNWSRGKNGKRFSIDYTVNMPKDLKLNLTNKYGDTFISELTGEALISVKYGNLKANKILRGDEKPLSKVMLKYGKGTIEEAGWLKLDVKYCNKFEIGTVKALMVMSGYSKLYVDKASSIVSDSKYDNYVIGEANNFVTEGGYSDYEFEKINKKLILTNKYGNCEVVLIPSGFEEINVDSKYGTVRLGIEPGASYRIEGEAGYGKITYPSTGRVSQISSSNSFSVNGVVGTETDPESKVKLLTKYGSIHLK
jgi:hypothetical protein